jgi:hypothetical protein
MTYEEALRLVAETEHGFVDEVSKIFDDLHARITEANAELRKVSDKFADPHGSPSTARATLEQYVTQAQGLADQVSYMKANTASLRDQFRVNTAEEKE